MGRAPDGRPRRRGGRAGAARAGRRAVARATPPARACWKFRLTATAAACARPACCPNAGPGLRELRSRRRRRSTPADRRRDRRGGCAGGAELSAGLLLLQARPACQRRPARGGRELWERALGRASTVVAHVELPDGRPARARERRVPRAGLRREGGHDRPPGRAHPAAAAGRRAPGRSTRAQWQVIADLAARIGLDLEVLTGPMASQQLFDAVPFYAGLTLEEIGGKGVRWQERRPPPRRTRGAGAARMSAPSVLAVVGYYEEWWIQVLKAIIIFAVGLQLVPVVLLAERKLLGRFQSALRPQPRRTLRRAAAAGGHPQAADQGAVPPDHLDRLPVRAGAADLDRHGRRRVRDHPVRQRPEHLRHARGAVRDRRLDRARCTCSRSARSPSTGSCSAAGPRARSTRSSARCAARRS